MELFVGVLMIHLTCLSFVVILNCYHPYCYYYLMVVLAVLLAAALDQAAQMAEMERQVRQSSAAQLASRLPAAQQAATRARAVLQARRYLEARGYGAADGSAVVAMLSWSATIPAAHWLRRLQQLGAAGDSELHAFVQAGRAGILDGSLTRPPSAAPGAPRDTHSQRKSKKST